MRTWISKMILTSTSRHYIAYRLTQMWTVLASVSYKKKKISSVLVHVLYSLIADEWYLEVVGDWAPWACVSVQRLHAVDAAARHSRLKCGKHRKRLMSRINGTTHIHLDTSLYIFHAETDTELQKCCGLTYLQYVNDCRHVLEFRLFVVCIHHKYCDSFYNLRRRRKIKPHMKHVRDSITMIHFKGWH